jgi:two-component system, chemotaxis family, protein-glutamate methylesterase/glutaminase
MTHPVRVLVADDSASMRQTLFMLFQEDPRIQIVGEATDGQQAVELAGSLRPDVITMDVMMPRLDGLAAIAEILIRVPTRILVVTALAPQAEDLCFRALAAGALEFIPKPSVHAVEDLKRWGRELADTICIMSEVPVILRRRSSAVSEVGTALPELRRCDIIGIAASTGGPQILAAILSALPADLGASILVAQHMAEGFVDGMLRWLGEATPLKLIVAHGGELCRPGHVYFPPGGHHLLTAKSGRLQIQKGTKGPCPSGDLLLTSLACCFGNTAAGVVLSGMGEDGAQGLMAIRTAGGVTVAQDEATCVVFGMPKAAIDLGAVERVASPEQIPPLLCALAGRSGKPE